MNNEALADNLLLARASGRSLFQQVMDIAKLTYQRRGMTAAEYYWYAMYEQGWTDDERSRMIGAGWVARVIQSSARPDWWGVGKDKILNYILLAAYGFQMPEVTAIYHPSRSYPGAVHLKTRAALEDWLRTTAIYPQFAKPVTGLQSKGQSLLTAYNADNDTLERQADAPIDLSEYAGIVCQMDGLTSDDGFLFQNLLEPDSRLEPMFGKRLSGVRTIVILDEPGPRIINAVWKIPARDNFADNYVRPGNLLASLDLETGEVTRLVTGWGADLQELTRHPDTDVQIVGTRVPDWDVVRDLTLRGSVLLPGILFQGWDIGLCEGGPRVIEANLGSALTLPQLVSRKGFFTDDFERFLAWAEKKVRADSFGALAE